MACDKSFSNTKTMPLTKKKYFYLISVILTASYFLPLLFNNLPSVLSSHVPWAIIWILSLVVFSPRVFLTKLMILVFIYGLFLGFGIFTFWRDMDLWNQRFLFTEFYHLSIGASVISYYFVSRDFFSLSKLARWAAIFILITAIMSIISSTIDPEYARNIIGVSAIENFFKVDEIMSMKKYGGGGYGTAIAFMSVLPLFVYFYKHITPSNKIFIFYLLIVIIALFSMQIFANIIIGLLLVFFSFIGLNRFKKSLIFFMLIIGISYTIPKQYFINSLYKIGNMFNTYEELRYKFTDFAKFLETGAEIEDPSTGTGGRAQRLPELIISFSNNPVWGCYFFNKDGNGYNPLGAHLYWANKLTTTGLVGFFIYISIIIYFVRKLHSIVNKNVRYYYLLSSIGYLSYGLIKNLSSKGAWFAFFVIIPSFLFLPYIIKEGYTVNPFNSKFYKI